MDFNEEIKHTNSRKHDLRIVRSTTESGDVVVRISRVPKKKPDETALILADEDLASSIDRGLADTDAGRVEDAADVFTELDAEMRDDG